MSYLKSIRRPSPAVPNGYLYTKMESPIGKARTSIPVKRFRIEWRKRIRNTSVDQNSLRSAVDVNRVRRDAEFFEAVLVVGGGFAGGRPDG